MPLDPVTRTRRRNRHVRRRRHRLGTDHSRRAAAEPSQNPGRQGAAAAHVGCGTLSAIGRSLPRPTAAQHRIERAWWFRANDRVRASEVMPRVVRRLTRGRKKPLLVALDWTDVRGLHTLMAAAVMRGRAVPLLWASYTTGQLHRSQNSFEEGLLRLLVSMLPGGVRVVLLADRGFGRAELARTCEALNLRDLVRIKPTSG
jgi:hypothetical protein